MLSKQCHHLLLRKTVALCCSKEPVSSLVDGGELRLPPELNNVVGKRHQLPLEGRGQGSLLLPWEGEQVAVVEPKPQKVVLGYITTKTLHFTNQTTKPHQVWGCRCPGCWDNSCRWWSRLRTPWRLWAQPLTSMAKAELMLVDVDVDVGWTILSKDLFFCIFVFLELPFCISGTFTNKRIQLNSFDPKNVKLPWKPNKDHENHDSTF